MKYVLTISLLGLLAGSGAALADEPGAQQGSMPGMSRQDSTMQKHHGIGTVNKVDLHNGKINLTHGPIKSLDWPGMSMTFRVKDKGMLEGIRPGQKVQFDLVPEKPGRFLIERIAPLE